MTQDDVTRFLHLCQSLGVSVWIDGGWGVDALLGEQTRTHGDLDIAIEERFVATLRAAMSTQGFEVIHTDDRSGWNFVVANRAGKRVDFHVIVIDAEGRGIYGPPAKGIFYPASSLTGTGWIDGIEVRCISAESQILFHSGYQLDGTDLADVVALHRRFGIALTPEQECLRAAREAERKAGGTSE